jgi:hypothetical protein
MSPRKHKFWLAAGFGLIGIALAALPAHADVRRLGDWPDEANEKISLTFEGTRSKALRALAAAAGWSIIDNPGSATFAGAGDTVNLYVTDQPAAKVLEMLLSDGDYVVKRDGKLLSISVHAPGGGPKKDEPTLPPPPPPFQTAEPDHAARPPKVRDADDRTVFGGSASISKDEVVNSLTVMGGSADLRGTVQEDVFVLGGSLTVHEGARVYGDVSVLGGAVQLESGSRVDGDVSSLGGHIQRAAGAIVKGEETAVGGGRSDGGKHVRDADDSDEDDEDDEEAEDKAKPAQSDSWTFASVLDKLGSALSRAALLYAFGCVLLATAGKPMERMQQELSERPMRAFGIGLATMIGGFFALILLCVTIIGIPVAILIVLVGALGVYAGMCAVFLELGALVLEDRTPSPYAHLALGCLMYLIFGTLPVIGWIATAVAVVCGLGLLVSTRFAGLIGRPPAQLTSPAST